MILGAEYFGISLRTVNAMPVNAVHLNQVSGFFNGFAHIRQSGESPSFEVSVRASVVVAGYLQAGL